MQESIKNAPPRAASDRGWDGQQLTRAPPTHHISAAFAGREPAFMRPRPPQLGLVRALALVAASCCSPSSLPGSSRLDRRSLKQCSLELDACRQAAEQQATPAGGVGFAALTREVTDATSALAASLAGSSAASGLPERYERDGHVTLRGVWPASVSRLALREVEEAWAHYRLPATFSGTAFLRAETDNPRIDSAGNAPFDRLYNIEERSPALRRLLASPGLGQLAAMLMGVDSVALYMTSYFRKVRAPRNCAPGHRDDRGLAIRLPAITQASGTKTPTPRRSSAPNPTCRKSCGGASSAAASRRCGSRWPT